MTHNDLLIFGRRIHNAFRTLLSIEGDGSSNWQRNQASIEHHLSGIYLLGCLAHLEGSYGTACWKTPGANAADFDSFVAGHPRKNIRQSGITSDKLDALVCVRNGYTHNDNDLSKNDDTQSLAKVSAADLPGLTLNGSVFSLDNSFTDFVRLCFVVAVFYEKPSS